MNNEEGAGLTSEVTEQLTSTKLLQEAFESKTTLIKRPQYKIQDLDELRSYQKQKRREYEQHLNKNKLNYGQWIRYARWEIEQNHEFARARSIMERALEVNFEHVPFWTFYIQLELSHKNVNHARNLLNRAVSLLPMVDKFWYMYVQTEEMVKNFDGVRQIFERWLTWHSGAQAWDAFVSFEKRYKEYERVRALYSRYVEEYRSCSDWLKWINFELTGVPQSMKSEFNIRYVFESCVNDLIDAQSRNEEVSYGSEFVDIIEKWTNWEASVDEIDRAKTIFDTLLNNPEIQNKIDPDTRKSLFYAQSEFERLNGNLNSTEETTAMKRLLKYKGDVSNDPENYDSWLLLISVAKHVESTEKIRIAFEESLKARPKSSHKSMKWRQYIYFWLYYALWEEFDVGNISKAREIWKRALNDVPQKSFTFAKIWLGAAEFELRNSSSPEAGLQKFRKILGRAIGVSSSFGPKRKLFQFYIKTERALGQWDRVRLLYEKQVEANLSNGKYDDAIATLIHYAEFEKQIEEHERCAKIFDTSLQMVKLAPVSESMVDKTWHACIDYYKEEMKYTEARNTYRAFVENYPSPDHWISFAHFESSIPTDEQIIIFENADQEELQFSLTETHISNTRNIFKEAIDFFKGKNLSEDRLLVLQAWKNYEIINGDEDSIANVEKRLPTIVKRLDMNNEETLEYIFPDEENDMQKSDGFAKFVANAKQWMSAQS